MTHNLTYVLVIYFEHNCYIIVHSPLFTFPGWDELKGPVFWEPCSVPLLLIKTTLLSGKGSWSLVQGTRCSFMGKINSAREHSWTQKLNPTCTVASMVSGWVWPAPRMFSHTVSRQDPEGSVAQGRFPAGILLAAFRDCRIATTQPWAAPCSFHSQLTQAHF